FCISPGPMQPAQAKPKLLDQLRDVLRTRHYSIRTERAYTDWVRRFILYHRMRHPAGMGPSEVGQFLTHLAVRRNVASSTQNQALNALLFFYREVLNRELGQVGGVVRARKPQRLPSFLSSAETQQVLNLMQGTHQLMARLLYGSGLRLMECCRLRVKDVDFEQNQIVVRDGKGEKDRVTMLPLQTKERLREHLHRVQRLHENDLKTGHTWIWLPYALEKKYPNAGREWSWQWVFPSRSLSKDPRSDRLGRHHVHENSLQKAVR